MRFTALAYEVWARVLERNGGASAQMVAMMADFLPEALALLGPAAAALGFFVVVDYPRILGATMLFASGGILYLVFQDIAPQAHLERGGGPALGAVLGFLLGLAGYLAVHG